MIDPMVDLNQTDKYVVLLTAMQSRLFAYVFSLLGDREQAADVLQETNLTLWRKSAEYDESRDFAPWAYRVAYFEVLAYRKTLGRQRLVFDDSLLEHFSECAAERGEDFNIRLSALEGCMERLTDQQRDHIRCHYGNAQSIRDIAELQGMSTGAVAQSLFRARLMLMKCIEHEAHKDQLK